MKKIGEIHTDSGIVLFGDLIELKKIKTEKHGKQVFIHRETNEKFTLGEDFFRFDEEFGEGLTYTDALQKGIIEAVKPPADEISGENITQNIENGFFNIPFSDGSLGKAFAALFEEGIVDVFEKTNEKGETELVLRGRKEEE
jgi:hypothetical protein